jgi:hypothetical protein
MCRVVKVSALRSLSVVAALASALGGACGDDDEPPALAPTQDASATDAGLVDASTASGRARAEAELMATAESAAMSGTDGEDAGVPFSGTAVFAEHPESIDMMLDVQGCTLGRVYQAVVQAGSNCSQQTLEGAPWDGARAQGISQLMCLRLSGRGTSTAYYARSDTDAKPWTLGGSSDSNLVGHALVVFDSETLEPVLCGVIARTPDAPPTETGPAHGPSVAIRAAVASVCLFDQLVPKSKPNCPDFAAAVTCSSEHCELDRCVDSCASYVRCLADVGTTDLCSVAFECEVSQECSRCQRAVLDCELGLCEDTLSCAAPASDDGPCSQLKTCCATQGAQAGECLQLAHQLVGLGGDSQCATLIDAWNNLGRFNVPCQPR